MYVKEHGGAIIYRSGLNPKIQRNFEVFTPCDIIAAITQHIPERVHIGTDPPSTTVVEPWHSLPADADRRRRDDPSPITTPNPCCLRTADAIATGAIRLARLHQTLRCTLRAIRGSLGRPGGCLVALIDAYTPLRLSSPV